MLRSGEHGERSIKHNSSKGSAQHGVCTHGNTGCKRYLAAITLLMSVYVRLCVDSKCVR